jgi:hypothetical protein
VALDEVRAVVAVQLTAASPIALLQAFYGLQIDAAHDTTALLNGLFGELQVDAA